MREQEHVGLVHVEQFGQARRVEQQQGDDGRQQLWERPFCPCLGDALVMGVSRFYLNGVSALMAELVRGAMLVKRAFLAKRVVCLGRQVSGLIGDKESVVEKCLGSRKARLRRAPPQVKVLSSKRKPLAAKAAFAQHSTCVQVPFLLPFLADCPLISVATPPRQL